MKETNASNGHTMASSKLIAYTQNEDMLYLCAHRSHKYSAWPEI